MGRKPNPSARPYKLSTGAREQRKQAAIDRWAALEGDDRSLSGRPRKKRKPVRGPNGRFAASK